MKFDVNVLFGDAYACLALLDDNSIDIAITSPPYWKQRDYGFEGQIGQESTPEEYIGRLVKVFGILRRKLKPDGVFFLNVGDKYLQRYGFSHLLQIPYRLAWHMVRDGWCLLDVLIWYKPNHMPSPVRDRFANTYEPVFVLSPSPAPRYRKGKGVLKIPLEQVPWKHTAVFPKRLVLELLRRFEASGEVNLLDPFAGTGTTGVAAAQIFPSSRVILIEKGEEFVQIIRHRLPEAKVKPVGEAEYRWEPAQEEFPDAEPFELPLSAREGLVYIAEDEEEFFGGLAFLTGEAGRWREDAAFFLGVKNWGLNSLRAPGLVLERGLVLRNMLVVEEGEGWFPVFMLVRDTKRVRYRFFLDRVRVSSEFEASLKPGKRYLGLEVKDNLSKNKTKGTTIALGATYEDGFPKVLWVRWEGGKSTPELVIHPTREPEIAEALEFYCPFCGARLRSPYIPYEENACPSCGRRLWESLESVPKVQEPGWVSEALERAKLKPPKGEVFKGGSQKGGRRSKFFELERLNWGASPGARQVAQEEYFTVVRLYKVEQPLVARFLNLARRELGLSVKGVAEKFPPEYKHTVGHWFRYDFGGSIPAPEDLELLAQILRVSGHPIVKALSRRALKLQTVRPHPKGRNPGDFLGRREDLKAWLSKLFR